MCTSCSRSVAEESLVEGQVSVQRRVAVESLAKEIEGTLCIVEHNLEGITRDVQHVDGSHEVHSNHVGSTGVSVFESSSNVADDHGELRGGSDFALGARRRMDFDLVATRSGKKNRIRLP